MRIRLVPTGRSFIKFLPFANHYLAGKLFKNWNNCKKIVHIQVLLFWTKKEGFGLLWEQAIDFSVYVISDLSDFRTRCFVLMIASW